MGRVVLEIFRMQTIAYIHMLYGEGRSYHYPQDGLVSDASI